MEGWMDGWNERTKDWTNERTNKRTGGGKAAWEERRGEWKVGKEEKKELRKKKTVIKQFKTNKSEGRYLQ